MQNIYIKAVTDSKNESIYRNSLKKIGLDYPPLVIAEIVNQS
jgi:hypothetical protein